MIVTERVNGRRKPAPISDDQIDVLMITHNRPAYTRMSLETLISNSSNKVRVWIWHNGDHAETIRVVKEYEHNVHRLHISPENVRLREPTNWILSNATGKYIGKVDDDCLVAPDWTATLVQALESDERLGVVACWHFREDDFDLSLVAKKLERLRGQLYIVRNDWVQGSGVLMKRECAIDAGLLPSTIEAFTPYCTKISLLGWKLGWVYPLILIDHMDDPRSCHSRFKSETDFARNPPLSAEFGKVGSLAEWKNRVAYLAREVQLSPVINQGRFKEFRRLVHRISRRVRRTLGKTDPWRMPG